MDVSSRLVATAFVLLCTTSLQLWAQHYRAPLQPVNPTISGPGLTGTVRLVQEGDELEVTVETQGLAPGIMHLQHLHGSRDGMDAECAPLTPEPGDDKVTDLIDTRQYSGITLIPLHDDPVSLDIKADTYPVSTRAGGYTYSKTIDWPALKEAMAEQYGIENIDLQRMVVYIHGVPENTKLPNSVRSLPGIPAHVTLPVACAQLDIQPTQH